MRTLLSIIKTVTGFTVFLLLLGFAIKNTDDVALKYFLGAEWHAPLIVMLLVFFAAGAAVGIAASFFVMIRQRRQILALRRDLRGLARAPAAPVTAETN